MRWSVQCSNRLRKSWAGEFSCQQMLLVYSRQNPHFYYKSAFIRALNFGSLKYNTDKQLLEKNFQNKIYFQKNVTPKSSVKDILSKLETFVTKHLNLSGKSILKHRPELQGTHAKGATVLCETAALQSMLSWRGPLVLLPCYCHNVSIFFFSPFGAGTFSAYLGFQSFLCIIFMASQALSCVLTEVNEWFMRSPKCDGGIACYTTGPTSPYYFLCTLVGSTSTG